MLIKSIPVAVAHPPLRRGQGMNWMQKWPRWLIYLVNEHSALTFADVPRDLALRP